MNGSLYWITDSLPGLIWFVCVYGCLGLSAALVSLPRSQWKERALVGALAAAFAPALLTAWLFILGSLGAASKTPLMTPVPMLIGCALMAAVLWGGVWRKRRTESRADAAPADANRWPRWVLSLLIVLLVVAVFLRWVTTAYWPFTAYDTLWVYGYQGRLYALRGFIPTSIGYYPPFMALQYASAQILFGINDHAARMTIPFLHIGGILAAYVLGRTLGGRRTGWALAALWGLYPHVGAWAQMGDLEIPLSFLFTLSAALFLWAWRDASEKTNRRMALLAGLVFGIAMWTKPTAGAFVWGVALLVAAELGRLILAGALRRDLPARWSVFQRRFMTAFYTGMACAPLGGAWYIRNILLGHAPIDFPPATWLTKATRSGDLLGWLLLALLIFVVAGLLWRRPPRETLILGIGTALLVLGAVPSMPWYDPTRVDPPMSYIRLSEAALIGGGGLILAGLLAYRWSYLSRAARARWQSVAQALLLALPYFITWFFSYSYHYRLSFAIVPLLMLPLALLLSQIEIEGTALRRQSVWVPLAAGALIVLLAVPGITATITEAAREDDWLWVDRYPDDIARYEEHVPEMMLLRDTLEAYRRDNGRQPVIIAPGEQRLPFFYPDLTIVTNTVPTRLDELKGFTHYIYGTQPEWRYQDEHIAPEYNQIVASLGRKDLMVQTMSYNDGIFRYEVYEPHLQARETPVLDYLMTVPHEVTYGGAIQWTGYSFSSMQFGNTIFYDLSFKVLERPAKDLTLRLMLVHAATNTVVYTTETCLAPGRYGCYRSSLWDAGEMIITSGKLIGDSETGGFPSGDYVLRVAFVADGQPVSVRVDGKPAPAYDLPGFR